MEKALVNEFIELVSIDAESGHEAEIAAAVMGKLREIGLDVEMDDAGNIFNANGISSIVLGTGCHLVHSTREFIPVTELVASARLVTSLLGA